MSRLPERVLGLVGVVLMTTGWTGFVTTVPLSELQGIDNDAEGLSVVLVWLQGVVLLLMALVLAAARRDPRSVGPGAGRWPWGAAPTVVGVLLVVVTAVVLGPVAALALLVVGTVVLVARARRGVGDGAGAGPVRWLETSVTVVMVVAGGYGTVVAAPGTVASAVELLVASTGLVVPGGPTAPPYGDLSLWGAPAVLAACWAVLLLTHLSAWRRRAGVAAVTA